MMSVPAALSYRPICDALRSRSTPHGRRSPRSRRVVRLPLESGRADQSRDWRDVPV